MSDDKLLWGKRTPTCPHCGHEHYPANAFFTEDERRVQCERCKEIFFCTGRMRWAWDSSKSDEHSYIDLIHYTPNLFNRERFLVGAILLRSGSSVAELIRAPLPPFGPKAKAYIDHVLDLPEPSRPSTEWEMAHAINERGRLIRVEPSNIALGRDIDPLEWLHAQIFTQWEGGDDE